MQIPNDLFLSYCENDADRANRMFNNFTKTLNVYLRSLDILKNSPENEDNKRRHRRNKETLELFMSHYKPLEQAFKDLNIEGLENI